MMTRRTNMVHIIVDYVTWSSDLSRSETSQRVYISEAKANEDIKNFKALNKDRVCHVEKYNREEAYWSFKDRCYIHRKTNSTSEEFNLFNI